MRRNPAEPILVAASPRTDTVAPSSPQAYYAVYDMYSPLWKQLTPEASRKVRLGNYQRLFDEARRRVRAWEQGTPGR